MCQNVACIHVDVKHGIFDAFILFSKYDVFNYMIIRCSPVEYLRNRIEESERG